MALDSRRNVKTPTRRGGVVPSTGNKTQQQSFPMPNMSHEAMVRRMQPAMNKMPMKGKNTLSSASLNDSPAGALNPNPASDRGYAPPGTQKPGSTSVGSVKKGTTPAVNKSALERAARRKLGM